MSISKALTSDFENIYYIDTATDYYLEFFSGPEGELRIQAGGTDFFEGFGHHLLSAEAGFDSHDQKHFDLVHIGSDILKGCFGFDGNACLASAFVDLVDHCLRVLCRLAMESDDISAAGRKLLDIADGIDDHQVDIENLAGGTADGLHHGHAEGNGGDEYSVHDIDVEVGSAALFCRFDVFLEVFEIRREHGRCEDEFWFHSFFSFSFSFFFSFFL